MYRQPIEALILILVMFRNWIYSIERDKNVCANTSFKSQLRKIKRNLKYLVLSILLFK